MVESLGRNRLIENGQEEPRSLLIPVGSTERSQWPLRYALARRPGETHIDLLCVGRSISCHQTLRFRTQAELAELQSQSAKWLLQHAGKPLQDAGFSVSCHFREGDIVDEIVESSEQLGSDAIVLPAPRPLCVDVLTRGIVRQVLRRPRATAVLMVDREGQAIAVAPPADSPGSVKFLKRYVRQAGSDPGG